MPLAFIRTWALELLAHISGRHLFEIRCLLEHWPQAPGVYCIVIMTRVFVLWTQEICALWCCLTWAVHLIQWTTIRCLQYFIDSSASVELCWTHAEATCVTARRRSRLGHCYLDPTTSGAVCPRCPFWVQKSLLLIQTTWQMSSVGVNLVTTCMTYTTPEARPSHWDYSSHCNTTVLHRGDPRLVCIKALAAEPCQNWAIWFGSRTNHSNTECMDLSLHVRNEIIKPVNVVRDLGILLDEELTMKQHISKVAIVVFYHIRRLKKVRSIVRAKITAGLTSVFILNITAIRCWPIYWSPPLHRYSMFRMWQRDSSKVFVHLTSALRDLQWLPVWHRITYKLCVLMHLVHTGSSPSYLCGLMTATGNVQIGDGIKYITEHRCWSQIIQLCYKSLLHVAVEPNCRCYSLELHR